MAAYFRAAIARQQAHDQRADNRHQYRPSPQRSMSQLEVGEAELPEIRDVGHQPDQMQQQHTRGHAGGRDNHRDAGHHKHPAVRREVCQMVIDHPRRWRRVMQLGSARRHGRAELSAKGLPAWRDWRYIVPRY